MTWEELVEKAKELGFESYGSCANMIQKKMESKQLAFWNTGIITCENEPIFYDRTPEQMYQIILALDDREEKKVKVGQVYFNEKIEKTLVITYTDETDCFWITSEGKVCYDRKKWLKKSCVLLAEYPTWQEAIGSKEFKG